MATAPTPVELHVVSDATGETAARLVPALEAQFPDQEFVEIRHPRDRVGGGPAPRGQPDEGAARRRRLHDRAARAARLDAHAVPARKPALLRPARPADRRRRARLRHGGEDDAGLAAAAQLRVLQAHGGDRVRRPLRRRRRAAGCRDADLVLVGVSRTSKTPLCIYLGYLGHKAANVPVVKGIEPPKELFSIDARKIVGLTIDPNRLVEIRRARVRTMGARNRQYAELMEIYEELERGDEAAPQARLPRDRHLRALDRGDGAPRAARPRGTPRRGEARMKEKPPVPLRYWALWCGDPRGRRHRLLRPADADLDRPARRRVARRVPVAPQALEPLEHARLERLLAVGSDAVAARTRSRRDDLAQLRPDVVHAGGVVERDACGEALARRDADRPAGAAPRRRSAGRRCRGGSRGRRACPRAAARTSR